RGRSARRASPLQGTVYSTPLPATSCDCGMLPQNSQCVVTVDDTVECVSVEGRARVADQTRDSDAIDHAIASYLTKYWDDPSVHPKMETFVRSHAIVE